MVQLLDGEVKIEDRKKYGNRYTPTHMESCQPPSAKQAHKFTILSLQQNSVL